MDAYYYSALDLATIISSQNLCCQEESRMIDMIWEGENKLLDSKYQNDKKRFILEEATFLERTPYEKLEEMLAEYVGLDIGSSTTISKKILILNIWEYTTDNGEDFKQCLNKFICRGIGIIYETAKTQLNRKTKRWLTV